MNIHEGDLFRLGRHRLLCGDSTQGNSYTVLLENNQIDLLLTDPPYGVDYSKKNEYLNKIDNGARVQREIQLDDTPPRVFMKKTLQHIQKYLREYNSYYIFCSSQHVHDFINTLEGGGIIILAY